MPRNFLFLLVALTGCASRPHTAPNMPPEPEPVAIVEALPERPQHPCVPVTDCRVVARHTLDSPFVRAARRHSSWRAGELADDAVFVEVTASCDTGTGFYIASGDEIWLPYPASCEGVCTEDLAGWNFSYEPIEVPHDARNFRPLGHGFYDDGVHIFERSETLEDVDRATFHACADMPEDPSSEVFYPCAEDARGLFGYGEHGDVGRFTP